MRVTGFQAIVPKRPVVDGQIVRQALMQAVDNTIKLCAQDFARTHQTWKTRPVFTVRKAYPSGTRLVGEVVTRSKIYMYVTRGTRPHIIKPRRKKWPAVQNG